MLFLVIKSMGPNLLLGGSRPLARPLVRVKNLNSEIGIVSPIEYNYGP